MGPLNDIHTPFKNWSIRVAAVSSINQLSGVWVFFSKTASHCCATYPYPVFENMWGRVPCARSALPVWRHAVQWGLRRAAETWGEGRLQVSCSLGSLWLSLMVLEHKGHHCSDRSLISGSTDAHVAWDLDYLLSLDVQPKNSIKSCILVGPPSGIDRGVLASLLGLGVIIQAHYVPGHGHM